MSRRRGDEDKRGGLPTVKLAAILYPFVAAAVAINLFLLGLMAHAIGLPALAPVPAIAAAVPLSLPAAWLAARWLRGLLNEAEAGQNEGRSG